MRSWQRHHAVPLAVYACIFNPSELLKLVLQYLALRYLVCAQVHPLEVSCAGWALAPKSDARKQFFKAINSLLWKVRPFVCEERHVNNLHHHIYCAPNIDGKGLSNVRSRGLKGQLSWCPCAKRGARLS